MINFLRKIGQALFRIWFYVLVGLLIIFFFPLLFISVSKESWYPYFFWMARNLWAKPILCGIGCWPNVKEHQPIVKGESYMLVANHTSMLDIMLMFSISKNPFVFVGKKELTKIPVFGFFFRNSCIMVDRNDPKSRVAVYKQAQHKLNMGLSICIFPEGGVPSEDVVLDKFKDGAFKMAVAHQIPIVPMTFLDCKKRFSWTFFSGGPGKLRAIVHPFVSTKKISPENISELRESVRNTILNTLKMYD